MSTKLVESLAREWFEEPLDVSESLREIIESKDIQRLTKKKSSSRSLVDQPYDSGRYQLPARHQLNPYLDELDDSAKAVVRKSYLYKLSDSVEPTKKAYSPKQIIALATELGAKDIWDIEFEEKMGVDGQTGLLLSAKITSLAAVWRSLETDEVTPLMMSKAIYDAHENRVSIQGVSIAALVHAVRRYPDALSALSQSENSTQIGLNSWNALSQEDRDALEASLGDEWVSFFIAFVMTKKRTWKPERAVIVLSQFGKAGMSFDEVVAYLTAGITDPAFIKKCIAGGVGVDVAVAIGQ